MLHLAVNMLIDCDCIYLAGDDVFMLFVDIVLHLVLLTGWHVTSELLPLQVRPTASVARPTWAWRR